jgi:DNA (cytosine-5)-methyltransferase 1
MQERRLEDHRDMGMPNGKHGKIGQQTRKKTQSLTAVELFAGIGGFRVATDSLGIRTLWANDLSPAACAVYRKNFGDKEICEGDIHELIARIPDHDLLTAGFPCQPFSSAGKKKGVRDPRGTLFQVIVDVLAEKQPKYFILENVKRLLTMEDGFHFATILASLADLDYRIEWRLLNAMHLGLPQNRQRVFLIGIHERALLDSHGLSNDTIRIRLASGKDIAQTNGWIIDRAWDMSFWKPIEEHGCRFPTWGMANSGSFVAADLNLFSEEKPPVILKQILEQNVARDFDFTETTLAWISTNTPVNRFVQGVEILSNQAGGARMGYTIFGINGVAPTLTSTTSRHYERYKVEDQYRRLTNIEYARIQGFDDNHCNTMSTYDQYPLYGNAVPPPMATWVMNQLLSDGIGPKDIPEDYGEMVLFHAHLRSAKEDSPE